MPVSRDHLVANVRPIEFRETVVRKGGPPYAIHVEAEKSRRAAVIGARTGLFGVPPVINVDSNFRWIDFERLYNIAELRGLILQGHPIATYPLLERVGRSLAAVHEQLTLDDTMKCALEDSGVDMPGEHVFLHGDFTARNVCVDLRTKDIVIVDWLTSRVVGETATFGSRFFDVIWFAFDLFSAYNMREPQWRRSPYVNAFLRGYLEGSRSNLSRESWRILQQRFASHARLVIRTRLKSARSMHYLPQLTNQYLHYMLWCIYRPQLR
jgi:tRNA A-37 threonylcarbamoyl transferase component Bud32